MKIKILEEFKQFAMRGNVVDMAVGIIIGGAFGKIVSSLVADIIMPPIGLLIGGKLYRIENSAESGRLFRGRQGGDSRRSDQLRHFFTDDARFYHHRVLYFPDGQIA